jgi:hypothetical protein
MQTNKRKQLSPILILFVSLNALFVAGKSILQRWGADQDVLIIGNLVLFVITLASFFLAVKNLKSSNPHAFTRGIFSSMLLKMFAFAIGAFIYISMKGKELNKPAFFTLMGLYLVYTFVEVASLTKLLRKPADG